MDLKSTGFIDLNTTYLRRGASGVDAGAAGTVRGVVAFLVAMISLAGRRPGSRQYERSSSEPNIQQPNYMAPLKRDYHIDPLSPDMLGPLIDLAYWSNFVEVRRDTAAALAALSMNSDNLSMMARAGTLGAVLALIGDGSRNLRTDGECIRDATLALAQIVKVREINERFLINPRGLDVIFKMMRGSFKSVKRHSLAVLQNLCQSKSANAAVVNKGGLRHLFALIQNKNDDIRRMAANVVSVIARTIEDKAMLFDNHVITLGLLMLRREFLDKEEAVELSLVDFFSALATVPAARVRLVRSNVSLVLLRKLKTQHMPLETIAKIFKCELSLACEPANHARLLEERLLAVVAKAVFADLPARFGLASLSVLGAMDVGADDESLGSSDGGGGRSKQRSKTRANTLDGRSAALGGGGDARDVAAAITARHSPPQQIMRHCVSLVNELTHSPECCETIIESQILMHVLQASMTTFKRDRRIGRTVSAMVRRLTLVIRGLPGARKHVHALAAQGALHAVEAQLVGNDLEQKSSAAHAIAAISDFKDLTHMLSQASLVRELVALAFIPENEEPVMRLITRCSDVEGARRLLINLGALDILLKLIPTCFRHAEGYGADLMRTLSNILPAASPEEKNDVVRSTAMKTVFRVSKLDTHPGKARAKQILNVLGQEASAFMVQMTVLNFARRMKDHNFRRKFKENKKRFTFTSEALRAVRADADPAAALLADLK